MTLPRFHVDTPLAVGTTFSLPRAVTRHALRALRLREGERVILFDGRGGEFVARLVAATEPEAEVAIERFEAREAESPWPFTVAQGLSSGDRMDWTVEKCVELGASTIVPLAAARSVVRLAGDRARSRRAHWQALAIAASEQCGRNRIAAIDDVMPLAAWCATVPETSLRLVLSFGGTSPRALARPAPGTPVVLLAGPEGGFDDRELQAAEAAGFRALSLGPRILRTETAAAAALAMLAALWERDAPEDPSTQANE